MYCCEDHVELAIDMYIDTYEEAPNIHKIKDNHSLSTACELCGKTAIYIVGNE